MINVHGLRRNVKNVVKNYSDAQIKVREATSNDPWGPSGTLMSEIADLTYNVGAFSEIMQVIWKRLNDHGKNWKHVYKALVLLEYLIKTGSEKVTHQCKENIYSIQTLKDFQYVEDNKDQGINVREKAKLLVALLKDDCRLKNERIRALKARERFAQATSHVGNGTVKKPVKLEEYDDSYNPFDDDVISSGAWFASEFETARPQTVGEEELQLQLALAMSKEEAAQTERLKRNDDLRLQMALTESIEDFKRCQISESEDKGRNLSAIDDLLGIALDQTKDSHHHEESLDPWGVPVSIVEAKSSISLRRQWNTLPTLSADPTPWSSKSLPTDPWNPKICNDGTSSSEVAQDNVHEILTNTNGAMEPDVNTSNSFCVPSMKKSISADSSFRNSIQEKSSKFLGVNPDLVDLNTLIGRKPFSVVHPFSTVSSNPFKTAKSSSITINELRAQNSMTFIPFVTSVPANANLPSTMSLVSNTDSSPANNPFM